MERLSIADWIAFDGAHPAPTFFARPAWALALADAGGTIEPHPLRVRIDGRSLIVPTVRYASRTGFSHLSAFPLGGYTCALDENGASVDALTASRAFAAVSASADYVQLVPWPLGPSVALPRAQHEERETAVIDCSAGYEAAIANVRGVTRRMAGQAERRGVACARSAASVADIDAYWSILEEASQGWGLQRPPYPRALIDAVFARGGDDVELWFATNEDGERIAGGIIFFGSDELFFWSAAMRRAHAQLRPSNALNFALIRAACERGVRWYNLGGSAGLAGVERFKTDLGAQSISYPAFTAKRAHFALYERVRATLRVKTEVR